MEKFEPENITDFGKYKKENPGKVKKPEEEVVGQINSEDGEKITGDILKFERSVDELPKLPEEGEYSEKDVKYLNDFWKKFQDSKTRSLIKEIKIKVDLNSEEYKKCYQAINEFTLEELVAVLGNAVEESIEYDPTFFVALLNNFKARLEPDKKDQAGDMESILEASGLGHLHFLSKITESDVGQAIRKAREQIIRGTTYKDHYSREEPRTLEEIKTILEKASVTDVNSHPTFYCVLFDIYRKRVTKDFK